MTVKPTNKLRIMAVDYCEHAVAALNAVPSSHPLSVASKDSPDFRAGSNVNLIAIKPCAHVQRDQDFDTVRDVISALAERYSDPALDLAAIAIKMRMSSKRLSMILNKM
jgi:hypothetical protein